MNGCGEILLNDRCPEELGERGRFSPKGLGTGWGILDVGRLGITGACGVSPELGAVGCAGCEGCAGCIGTDWKAGWLEGWNAGFGGATGDGADGVKGANIVFGRGAGENLKIYIEHCIYKYFFLIPNVSEAKLFIAVHDVILLLPPSERALNLHDDE